MKYRDLMTELSHIARRVSAPATDEGDRAIRPKQAVYYQDLRWDAAQVLFKYLRLDGAAQIALAEKAGVDVQWISALKGRRHWKNHVRRPVFEALLEALPPGVEPYLVGGQLKLRNAAACP